MCGIFGVIDSDDVTKSLIKGLRFLQHRGQDAAGLYTLDMLHKKEILHKDFGLVKQVFSNFFKSNRAQTWGISHVRYATSGVGELAEIQPLKRNEFIIAHNGNIVNYLLLKRMFELKGHKFKSKSDAEVLLHYFDALVDKKITFKEIEAVVRRIFLEVQGSYSVILLIKDIGMIAFRDPKGLRPLLMGTKNKNDKICFSSESYPLTLNECDTISDLKPAELIFIDKDKNVTKKILLKSSRAICSFEFNYFANPTSVIERNEIYRARANLGKYLAYHIIERKISADVVVPVPDTGTPAALALGHALKIPVEMGLIKQTGIGRTFIAANQFLRESLAAQKWAVVESVFKNKDVILVDDSIVRGTVSKKVVALAKKAKAKKIFFASTYPPIKHPCFYGIDFPEENQLISANLTDVNLADKIKADEVIFNDISDLKKAVNIDGICTACIDGNYPTKIDGKDEFQKQRISDLKTKTSIC